MTSKKAPAAGAKKKRSAKQNSIKAEAFIPLLKDVISEVSSAKSPKSVIELLAAKNIHSPVLFVGEHHVRVKRIIDWMKTKLFEIDGRTTTAYFGTELSSEKTASHLVEALCCPSLFSSEELLVLYEADKVKAPAASKIIDGLQRSANRALLLCLTPARNQRAALLSKFGKQTIVLFDEASPRLVQTWIQKEVRRFGAGGISTDALQLLQRSYGTDLDALSREIGKLCLLSKPGATINLETVRNLTLRSPEVRSFALIDAMAKGEAANASALSESLLAQGLHPLQLNAFLSRAFRTLLAKQQRGSTGDESKELQGNMPSELSNAWFLKNLSSARRKFSAKELEQSLTILAGLDFQLKDSTLPHPLAMGIAIQRIASRRPLGSALPKR